MKRIWFIIVLLFPVLCFAQMEAVDDSSLVPVLPQNRQFLVIGGYNEVGGKYHIALMDIEGAFRDASFDSMTVDTLMAIGTDTILVTDTFSYSPTIKAFQNLQVRTNKFVANKWVYMSAGEIYTLPIRVSSGDSIFVSTTTLPKVQILRGKVKQ